MGYIHTIYNTKSKQSIKFACLKHILGIRLLYNYSSLKNQNTFYIFTLLALAATKFFMRSLISMESKISLSIDIMDKSVNRSSFMVDRK